MQGSDSLRAEVDVWEVLGESAEELPPETLALVSEAIITYSDVTPVGFREEPVSKFTTTLL